MIHDSNVMFEKLFSRRGLSFDRLRVLLEVRDAGSIAKAAGGDPVRQSQFSRQLKELEEFFGVELTVRHGRLLKLTAAGEELAGLVREHLISLGDFSRKVADEPTAFSIGAGDLLIHWLILPRVVNLSADLMTVSLSLMNLRSEETVEQLHARSLDFGVIRDTAIPATFGRHSLGRVDYALAVPESLAKRVEVKARPEALAQLPIAVLGASTFANQFFEQCRKAGIRPNVRLECSSLPAVCRAIATGAFAGVLPKLAETDSALRGVRFHDLKMLASLSTAISLVWLERRLKIRPLAPKVQSWLAAKLTIAKR